MGANPTPVTEEKESFDWRIIIYVSIPAVVLGAQLFFTFSRDAFIGTPRPRRAHAPAACGCPRASLTPRARDALQARRSARQTWTSNRPASVG